MNELILTARPLGDAETYLPLSQTCLRAEIATLAGDGSAAAPWVQRITLTAGEDFAGVIRMALPVPAENPRFFLPGFMYGTNRGDAPLVVDSPCPRLRQEMSFPASPWWMVRSDRLSHPAAFVYAGGRMTGLCASPYFLREGGAQRPWQPGMKGSFSQYAGFGCALDPSQVFYTLGYENAPWLFIESHDVRERAPLGDSCFRLAAGERVAVDLYLFDYAAQDERGLHGALQGVYGRFHEPPRRLCSVKETVAAIAGAVARDAWLPERHGYAGFVFDRGDHDEYRPLPSIAWTNGLSTAVPMLQSALCLGDEAMRAQAVEAIDHIVRHSLNPRSNLPFMAENDGVWSNRGWWYDRQHTPGHAAYLVGQSAYLLLKACRRELARGADHPEWLAFARQVVARTEKSRNADGEYPYIFSDRTGAGLEYDSFSGCWCLAAAALLAEVTGETAGLPALLDSERHYHSAYILRQECYGGPLDIDKNVDSEGVLAYIRAAACLHRLTGSDALLDHLRDALHYEFTFKFCYNSPIKAPPLSIIGWSSCGGSITSVVNPHIHPMSSSVLDEMHYYLTCREDAYIRSRMEDTLLWSCQTHSTYDREYGYGRRGWMSERFCHCEGLLKERYPDGTPASTWFALMPWAAGSILEGLTGSLWGEA